MMTTQNPQTIKTPQQNNESAESRKRVLVAINCDVHSTLFTTYLPAEIPHADFDVVCTWQDACTKVEQNGYDIIVIDDQLINKETRLPIMAGGALATEVLQRHQDEADTMPHIIMLAPYGHFKLAYDDIFAGHEQHVSYVAKNGDLKKDVRMALSHAGLCHDPYHVSHYRDRHIVSRRQSGWAAR